MYALGKNDFIVLDLAVGSLAQEVTDAIEARLFLVRRLDDLPGRLGNMGALQHLLLGLGVLLPQAARLAR